MPRITSSQVNFRINGQDVLLPVYVVREVPDSIEFVRHLLTTKVSMSIPTAVLYARTVANAKREGLLSHPHALTKQLSVTAVKAYWKWATPLYDERLRRLSQLFLDKQNYDCAAWLRDHSAQLRVSSLIPPSPTKVILRPDKVAWRAHTEAEGARIRAVGPDVGPPRWPEPKTQPEYKPPMLHIPCPDQWTLHVPDKASTPHHHDPCETCRTIFLSDHEMTVIRTLFHEVWGTEDFSQIPGPAFLFGNPPPESAFAARAEPQQEKLPAVMTCAPVSVITTMLDQLKASLTGDPTVFVTRLKNAPSEAAVLCIDEALWTRVQLKQLYETLDERLLQREQQQAETAAVAEKQNAQPSGTMRRDDPYEQYLEFCSVNGVPPQPRPEWEQRQQTNATQRNAFVEQKQNEMRAAIQRHAAANQKPVQDISPLGAAVRSGVPTAYLGGEKHRPPDQRPATPAEQRAALASGYTRTVVMEFEADYSTPLEEPEQTLETDEDTRAEDFPPLFVIPMHDDADDDQTTS